MSNDQKILEIDDRIVAADQDDMDAINALLEIRFDLVAENEIQNPEPFYEPVEGDPKVDPKEEPSSIAASAIIDVDEDEQRFVVRYANPTSEDVRFDIERVPGRDTKNTVRAGEKETSHYALSKGQDAHVIRVTLDGNVVAEKTYTAARSKENK